MSDFSSSSGLPPPLLRPQTYATPPPPSPSQDRNHLEALAIAHYVVGGLVAAMAALFVIWMLIGSLLLAGGAAAIAQEAANNMPPQSQADPVAFMFFPTVFGGFFVLMFSLYALFGAAIGVGIIYSGRFLKQQRNYIYSFVVACLLCTSVPVGTILGVFTIVVLSRDSVKCLYGRTF
jgi:hypothetical protein